MSRPTVTEQRLLDEYNAIMRAIRLIDAGERMTGTSGVNAKAALWRQADDVVRRAKEHR